MTAAEAVKRLQSLEIENIALASFQETAADFISLNKKQWSEGVRKDGTPIVPAPYTPAYAKVRKKEGLQTDFIDLKRKGIFYNNYQLQVTPQSLNMSSNVDYEKYLTKNYALIWGLDEESKKQYLFGPFWGVMKPKIETAGFSFTKN